MSKYIRGNSKIKEARTRLTENLQAEERLKAASDMIKNKPDELLILLQKEYADISNKLELIAHVKQIELSLKQRLKIIEPFIKKLANLQGNNNQKTVVADTEDIKHLEDFNE